MKQLVPLFSPTFSALMAPAEERARRRFLDFFTANIRNPHTRRAYAEATREFMGWCNAAR